jgi:anthranilate 1,2-dioxygenase ferredoxin component
MKNTIPEENFQLALQLADLPASGSATIVLNGWHVLLVRAGDKVHALNDRCSHAAAPLSTGRIRNGSVMCLLHGARFDLASGKCIGGAHRAVRIFPARISGDWIEVALPAQAPGLSELPVLPA